MIEADGFIVARRDGSLHCVAVDREDYARVEAAGPWSVHPRRDTAYAMHTFRRRDGTKITEYLHRFLLDLHQGDSREVDHVDGCGLHNRRANLRVVTHAEQTQNIRRRTGTSIYRGVSWDPRRQKWRAQVQNKDVHQHCGYFVDEIAAARAAAGARAHVFTHHNEARHPILRRLGVGGIR